MENKNSDEGTKGSKINQNILIAIIGAVATIVATVIPVLLNNRPEPSPTPTPLVITAVVTATTAPVLPTETLFVPPTETAQFTSTVEPSTATVPPQEGIFNGFLASDSKGIFTTTKYKPDEIIYLSFDINDPTGKNVVKVIWSVVEAKGFLPGAVKSDTTNIATELKPYRTLTNHSASPWDVGKYKVDIYLNDVLEETIPFEIVP